VETGDWKGDGGTKDVNAPPRRQNSTTRATGSRHPTMLYRPRSPTTAATVGSHPRAVMQDSTMQNTTTLHHSASASRKAQGLVTVYHKPSSSASDIVH
jgi:hypothetical protein